MKPTPRHILVIEDQPDIVDVLEEILAEDGYTVSIAGSAEAALERLRSAASVDLILLDVRLPVMSGIELLDRLNGSAERVPPVVAITAGREFPTGIEAVLRKPFQVEELLDVVHRYCPPAA